MALLRRHGAFALALLPLAALYFWLTWFPEIGTGHGDGIIYLVTARHYAPYWPADALAATWAAQTQFPPLYPALLAAAGGPLDFRLAHGATTVFLLAAFAACYAWLVALGTGRALAAAATAAFALVPGTFLQSLYLHPEGLYVALVLLALALLARAEQDSAPALFWVAAAAVGAAILTRTVGVTLLPALAIVLFRQRPARWPAMLVLAVAPAIAWNLAHDPPWSYTDTLRSYYVDAPASAIWQTLATSIVTDATGLLENLLRSARLRGVVALLALVAAGVAVVRFLRGRADAWYVAGYVAVLALWPFPEEARRLSWVLVPFVVGYAVLAAQALAARAPATLERLRPALPWAPVAVLALVVLPELALLLGRATHPLAASAGYRHYPEWYEAPLAPARWLAELHRATPPAMRRFGRQLPEGECAFSTMPLIASFHSGRDVRPPPPEAADAQAFEDGLRAAGCRFFIFTLDSGRGFSTFHYPLERVRDRVEILDEVRIEHGGEGERLVAALGVLRR